MKLASFESKQRGGESFLLIPGREQSVLQSMERSGDMLLKGSVRVLLEYPEKGSEVAAFVSELYRELSAQGMRWAYVVGIGAGSSIAQALALEAGKFVRRLALVNPRTRLQTSRYSQVIDYLERHVPCGLPLRKLGDEFDSRPEIHRVHAPTLILTTRDADADERAQAEFLSQRLPNSWKGELGVGTPHSSDFMEKLSRELNAFAEVKAKAPQKNLQGQGASSSRSRELE